jgi:alpha-beta hydrolase superfamily lysophospholipase
LKLFSRSKALLSSLAFLSSFAANTQIAGAEPVACQQTVEGKALNLPMCCWKEPGVETKAIIFAIHGVTFYSETFDEPAKHLASEGYPFYALDMRGFGRWQSESKKFDGDAGIHYSQTQIDLENVLRKLRSEYPDKKVIVVGESIGANLALWLASKDPDLLDGVILSSPCIKPRFHPIPRILVDCVRGVLYPNARQTTAPYIKKYISEDKRVREAYFEDPQVVHYMSPVETYKSLKTNTLALLAIKDIPADMPILILAGRKDQVYNAHAIPQFAERLGSENKTVVIEKNKGHILLETKFIEPDVLVKIDDWLEKTVPATTTTAQKAPDQISSVAATGIAVPTVSQEPGDTNAIEVTK